MHPYRLFVASVITQAPVQGLASLICGLALLVPPVNGGVTALPLSVSASIVSSSSWTDSVGYIHVVGEVVNNGSQNEDFVEIDATYFSASNAVVGTDFTFSELDTLTPGEKSPFVLLFDPSSIPGYDHYTLGPVTGSLATTPPSQLFTTTVTSIYTDIAGYQHVVGTVLNRNSATEDYVEPVFTFYGNAGVVDGDYAFVNTGSTSSSMAPCQTAAFELIRAPEAPAFTSYAVLSQSSSSPVPDNTLPTAPGNVQAVAGNASASVSWNASTADACNPVTGYLVTTSPGGQTTTTTSTSVVVSGLTNGTTYTFTVRAANANGYGPASAPSNAVTPATVPSSPYGVVATAGNLSATITWSRPGSSGGISILSYTVTSSPDALVSTVGGSALTATISGLTLGTVYTFTVVATNAVGSSASSVQSNPITAVSLPSAPTNIVAVAAGGSAVVSWTQAANGGLPITAYLVTPYVNGTPLQPITFTNAQTFGVIVNLTNGTTYAFTVTAINALGNGPSSAQSNPVTPDAAMRPAFSQGAPAAPGTRPVIQAPSAGPPPR